MVPSESGQSCRILVAEDNAVNRKVTGMILDNAGHRVDMVSNGAQALEALEIRNYDLVIVDMQMPVMGGLDALKMYRMAHHARAEHLPFLVLTANATVDARRMCEEAGADAYLTKPVDSRQLLHNVAQLTHLHEVNQHEVRSQHSEGIEIFDDSVLLELDAIRNRPGALRDIIQLFNADAEEMLLSLKDDWRRADVYDFKDHAHALKGSAANVGANSIARTCSLASSLTPGSIQSEGQRILEELDLEFENFDRVFTQFLNQQGSTGKH